MAVMLECKAYNEGWNDGYLIRTIEESFGEFPKKRLDEFDSITVPKIFMDSAAKRKHYLEGYLKGYKKAKTFDEFADE